MIRQMKMSKAGESDEKSGGKVETGGGERKDEEKGCVVVRAEQTETKIVSRVKRI